MKYIKAIILWFIKTITTIYLTIIILSSLFIALIAILVGIAIKNEAPKQHQPSHLVLSFPQPMPEASIPQFDLSTFKEKSTCFFDVISAIDSAKSDKNIKGVVLDVQNWNLTLNQTSEIAQALEKFKETKKPVLAYGSFISNNTYLAAITADHIVMPNSASTFFTFTGYHSSMPYFKELADKLGVKMNVVHIGNFKAFGENYNRDSMSIQLRTELKKVLNDIYKRRLNKVCDKRNIEVPLFRSRTESGKFALLSSHDALKHGLIDAVGSLYEWTEKLFPNTSKISITNYATRLKQEKMFAFSTKQIIAVITLEGEIIDSLPEESLFAENNFITPRRVEKICDEIRGNDQVAGVVLRINSPGGSALASELICQELEILNEDVPVYVSMGNVAASGGYYIASNTDKIFAESDTITGSIGVVSIIPDLSAASNKLGIKFESVTKGRFSDLMDLNSSSDPEKLRMLEKAMEKTYMEFLGRVAVGRDLNINDLHHKIAQGRIWTGTQALENGLIDQVGSLSDTIEALAQELNLKNWEHKIYPQPKNIFERISEMNIQAQQAKLPSVCKPLLPALKQLERCQTLGNRPLTLLPYELNLQN